jgi:phosphatidylserine/phosphatidylglycerophosphate/cardiolipin synthase-like enzyme
MSEPTSRTSDKGIDRPPGTRHLGALFLGLLFCAQAFCFPVSVTQAPRDDIYLTLSAIGSAKHSLLINIYEMKSKEVGDAIVDRIRAGVQVQILEEGQPVGGVSTEGRQVRSHIVEAMQAAHASAENRFYSMYDADKQRRRYHFDHAKYIVIDEQRLLIGSENYSSSLNEPSVKPGNRGWEVLLDKPELASEFAQMFRSDCDPSDQDITDLVGEGRGRSLAQDGLTGAIDDWAQGLVAASSWKKPIPHGAVTDLEADDARTFESPASSLSGLVDLLGSARQSVKLELMTFNPKWGMSGKVSPLYDAVVAAARRGVTVRVLLNDENAFGHSPKEQASHKHPYLVRELKALAAKEHLDLDARIANLKAMNVTYIHNKGALIDGSLTLISSINWNENSVEHNRETAAVVESPQVNQHYDALFEADWKAR